MTRKLKSDDRLELSLSIKDDDFIAPPRVAQRNALLNSAVKEFVSDLYALHDIAGNFVPGNPQPGFDDRTQANLTDTEIMEDWQIPVMRKMVDNIARPGGHLLEIGFGRGISAEMIQACGVQKHTIIECNATVVERFQQWRLRHPQSDIELVTGLWQDSIETLGSFDAIFFHTYPLNEDEYMEYVYGAATFAEHFFPVAAAHLNPGGQFTYFSNEIDSLSRAHQRQLLAHFGSFSVQVIPLQIPEDVIDTWWAGSMAIVTATK